jgi:HAAS
MTGPPGTAPAGLPGLSGLLGPFGLPNSAGLPSSGGLPGAAEQVIGSYLTEIADRLIGPARARRDILAELGAGLMDAADAYRSAGLAPAHAARAAITEFGQPERVADGFQAELTSAQARRTALTLMRTGPLIGLLWTGAAVASHIGARLASPWHWASMPASGRLVIHLAGFAFAITIGSALVTVAATGRLTRWLPTGPGSLPAHPRWLPACPAASAALAASGTAAIDIALLALLASQAASTPGRLAALPVAVAAIASLIRLTLTTRAARNCLTTSAACLSLRLAPDRA